MLHAQRLGRRLGPPALSVGLGLLLGTSFYLASLRAGSSAPSQPGDASAAVSAGFTVTSPHSRALARRELAFSREEAPAPALPAPTEAQAAPLLEDPPDAALRPDCQALYRDGAPPRSLAVVGNAPLAEEQRAGIAAAQLVMRFNKLVNWFCGDRLDVWVLRYAHWVPHLFHGLGEVQNCLTEQALEAAQAVFLLDAQGPPAEHAAKRAHLGQAARLWPRLAARTVVEYQHEPLLARYAAEVGTGDPSSGWIGLQIALDCTPPSTQIDLYGFNWHFTAWEAHNMTREAAYAAAQARAGRVRIHAPPCFNRTVCGACFVVKGMQGGDYECLTRAYGAGGSGAPEPEVDGDRRRRYEALLADQGSGPAFTVSSSSA